MMFKKPKGVSYTQMAMWIDENIYKDDCDMNQVYEYMYLLAYMLGCKSRYFHSLNDYDGFASHLAYSTYIRMTDKEKPRIKSVLNYMKSIQYFRKLGYEKEAYSEIIDPAFSKPWDSDKFVENYKRSLESENKEKLQESIIDLLKTTPNIIRKNIPILYQNNRVTFLNVYISCLLTMINRVTLPNQYKNYFQEKTKDPSSFNEANYYRKHLDKDVILWNIPDSMEDVINMIINKVNNTLTDEIKSFSNEIKLSDEDFSSIISTAFGDNNETTNN